MQWLVIVIDLTHRGKTLKIGSFLIVHQHKYLRFNTKLWVRRRLIQASG
jgi:hypothetical protein